MFGLTLAANNPGYVRYSDPIAATAEQIKQLSGQTDFVIALTHQAIDDDIELLQNFHKSAYCWADMNMSTIKTGAAISRRC